MSEVAELKLCPLCGVELGIETYCFHGGPTGVWLAHPAGEHAKCPMGAMSFWATPETVAAWNTRPAESTLIARVAELERERDDARQRSRAALAGLDQEGANHWTQRDRADAAEARLAKTVAALRQIADLDEVEGALDPEWAINRARAALSELDGNP